MKRLLPSLAMFALSVGPIAASPPVHGKQATPRRARQNAPTQTLRFRYFPQRSARFLDRPAEQKSFYVQLEPSTAAVNDWNGRSIEVHPDGRFLYGCGDFLRVSQYHIGPAGTVTALKPSKVEADYHPSSLSFHPNGRFAYVTCSHGAICQYRIGRSGQLIPLSPNEVFGTNNPMPLRFDLSARFVCVVADGSEDTEQTVYVNRINQDGTLTLVNKIHAKNIEVSAREVVVCGNRVIADEYASK